MIRTLGREVLAKLVTGSELVIAEDAAQARAEWPKRIGAFLKQAWMKEPLGGGQT